MASITEHLELLQKLTRQNLDILLTINDSFFTKQDHLTATVDNSKYVIPSFMSLENKINSLQESFTNLVNAPENGEAYFNFDGNTRSIEVRGYTHTPNSLTLPEVSVFNVETNNIFKDFLTPNPYIHFGIDSLPNDITSVVVKKIIPKHIALQNYFKSCLMKTYTEDNVEYEKETISAHLAYKDIHKVLAGYRENIDYITYDTIRKLPIRKNIGSGVYVIEEIVSDITDENLDQYLTLKLRHDLTGSEYLNNLYYRVFDETLEKPLQIGDEIISYEGNVKMQITQLHSNSNTMVVKVLNGEYLNLSGAGDAQEKYISSTSKLRFYSPINFSDDKYINIPIEEDQYIYVAVAPLNDRMNVQAPWGTGLVINTYILENGGAGNKYFKDYYRQNIKNIGDVLNEMSTMMDNTLTKYSLDEFNQFIKAKPTMDEKDLVVVQINSHINDDKTIQDIRTLYSQKLKYKTDLDEIQTDIDNYNKQLSETSFDDVNNTRASITAQISSLNKRKNELITSLTKVINDISLTANNSEIPIEDAKYRIRGYFDIEKYIDKTHLDLAKNHIHGIKVQYRYKNHNRPQGQSLSINGKFLFSDWIDMNSFILQKEASYDDGYKFKLPDYNGNANEPSFNQIDIPVTQGESVDIKVKVLYDFGYPFVQITSDWSDIINVKFPQEYLKSVTINSIIQENNNDIETNRFNNILVEEGIPEHMNDHITDQDITYYHKPENISSGFYTNERRIIPLKDKLVEMDANINSVLSEINDNSLRGLSVTAEINGVSQKLQEYQLNNISVEPYDAFMKFIEKTGLVSDGGYSVNGKKISVIVNVKISNNTNRVVKLFPIFPGDGAIDISRIKHAKFEKDEYAYNAINGVWLKLQSPTATNKYKKIQTANQFITFRILNSTSGQRYYFTDEPYELFASSDKQTSTQNIELPANAIGAALYPYVENDRALLINGKSEYSYLALNAGEQLTIPLNFEYNMSQGLSIISKVVTFDVRTSLYQDPVSFNLRVTAKKFNSTMDKTTTTDKSSQATKYNTVISN